MASTEPERLRLTQEERADLWQRVVVAVERHWAGVNDNRVAPILDPEGIRERLGALDFDDGMAMRDVLDFAVSGLSEQQVHTAHRRYFGLFNPSPSTMGVAADTLVAAFNPQLAAWSHSPFAVEVERYLIKELSGRFGFAQDDADGVFASGGAEANHTAVLTALVDRIPEYRSAGVDPADGRPTMYVTAEAHDSLRKAASLSGVGFSGVRTVPTDGSLRMDVAALSEIIASDRGTGCKPFLIVGTAGTTSAGIVDPLRDIADVAALNEVWFHVDAAWGGAAALSASAKRLVDGINRADSITFDAHKWLSVPMGAGIFLTRHKAALSATFGTENAYMPRDAVGFQASLDLIDPFSHSIQWSRRFTGLKLFLTLAVAGWSFFERLIDDQIRLGDSLRQILDERNWEVVNDTRLPVVCVADRTSEQRDRGHVDALVQRVVNRGRVWVSSAGLSDGRTCIRACITNFATDETDLIALASELDEARSSG